MNLVRVKYLFFFFYCFSYCSFSQIKFPWLANAIATQTINTSISPPAGFTREISLAGSFEEWLRQLPLRPEGTKVYLHNGTLKGRQDVHQRVISIDCGEQNLQQCADAVMRLRAEYLFHAKKYQSITFNFTNGMAVPYSKWKDGYRLKISGNKTSWYKAGAPDESYATFKKYLIQIFNYAGTSSLEKELKKVISVKDIQPGDVFINGGFPGHAVIVVDVVKNKSTGKKTFLLAQSYMPAQDIHILKNFNWASSPWYTLEENQDLITPEWTFPPGSLKRFN